MLGATRVEGEPFGLAIRSYVESPRHADRHIEACLTMRDANGNSVPGYGWMFPAGDGTVNIGVGALSTMKGFKSLNLNSLIDLYRDQVREAWGVGPYLEKPRAWRLPMTARRRHGDGWVAVGDAAGLVNPMNGEGIDYGWSRACWPPTCSWPIRRRPRRVRPADRRAVRRIPAHRATLLVPDRPPRILNAGLRVAVGTQSVADITLKVMGNLVDSETPGAAGRVLRAADRVLAVLDPLLRRTRA
jgi:menaquinone-9 beta-reductase